MLSEMRVDLLVEVAVDALGLGLDHRKCRCGAGRDGLAVILYVFISDQLTALRMSASLNALQ